MHELSLTRNILEIVLEASGGATVRRIDLRIGALTGVTETHLRGFFELLAHETAAAGAQIRVETDLVQGFCACGWRAALTLPLPPVCPECGAPPRFQGGTELEILRIEVDDGD